MSSTLTFTNHSSDFNQIMEGTSKILKDSVHTFLQNYEHFAIIVASLALSFSTLFLIPHLTSLLIPSSPSSSLLLPRQLRNHFQTLFRVTGFPTSLGFFTIYSPKLSETVISFIFTLHLATTFLLSRKGKGVEPILIQSKWSGLIPPFEELEIKRNRESDRSKPIPFFGIMDKIISLKNRTNLISPVWCEQFPSWGIHHAHL